MTRFGKALRQEREALSMSAYKLSQVTGVPTSALTVLEQGKRRPTREVMAKLAVAFDGRALTWLELCRAKDVLEAEGIDVASVIIRATQGGHEAPRAEIVSDLYSEMSTGGNTVNEPIVRLRVFEWAPDVSDWKTLKRREEWFPVSLAGAADYGVQVSDNSLLDLGFRPGTMLFVTATGAYSDGDPALALLDSHQYIFRTFRARGKSKWLEANPLAVRERIYINKHDVRLIGNVHNWCGPGGEPRIIPESVPNTDGVYRMTGTVWTDWYGFDPEAHT